MDDNAKTTQVVGTGAPVESDMPDVDAAAKAKQQQQQLFQITVILHVSWINYHNGVLVSKSLNGIIMVYCSLRMVEI